MRLVVDMDGMEHEKGSTECCSEMRCPHCGGRRHLQGTAMGGMILCEVCDAGQWVEAPQRHSEDQ